MHAFKGISLRQPMAFLIMSGVKDVENRFLNVTHRGPLLIHVSKTETGLDPSTWGPVTQRAMKRLGFDAKSSDCADDVRKALGPTLGHVIGVVELVDVVRNSKSEWANRGECHWLLSNPRALVRPFDAAGNTSMVNFQTKGPIPLVDGTELHGLGSGATSATTTPATTGPSSAQAPTTKVDIEDVEATKVLAAIRAVLTEHTELEREELVRQVHVQLCARVLTSITAIQLVGVEPERHHA